MTNPTTKLERVLRMIESGERGCFWKSVHFLREHSRTLLEAMRDAERYRLLRKGAVEDVAVVRGLGAMDYGMSAVAATYSEEIDGDDLDAAINAAMQQGGAT